MGHIQVYTGNGKGKTTAALGLTVRAVGAGHRVWFGQFAKGLVCNEHKALESFSGLVTMRQFGDAGFVTGEPSETDRRLAAQGLTEAREALGSGRYEVVVLDEACVAVHLGLLDLQDLLAALRGRAKGTEVVLTGRNAPGELLEMADLVTEMKEVKHYYSQGVPVRPGIEK